MTVAEYILLIPLPLLHPQHTHLMVGLYKGLQHKKNSYCEEIVHTTIMTVTIVERL